MVLKLYYFPSRSRGESIRMLLHHFKVPFEDAELSYKEFGRRKAEGWFPLGQVPVLETDDGTLIPQSGAIMRYLAKIAGAVPEDPIEAAMCDALYEATQDLRTAGLIVNRLEGEAKETEMEKYLATLPKSLKYFEKNLGEKQFLMGDKVSYCDFAVWHYLDLSLTMDPDLLEGYPNHVEVRRLLPLRR